MGKGHWGKIDFGVWHFFYQNPSVLGVPYSKMNSGFTQSGQIFLIFQSSNCFHLLKVSPSLAKIVSNDQMI